MPSPQKPVVIRAKKPYRKPTIHFYGSIGAITRSVSAAGSAKDGGPNNIKT
jgi:hypothetical protein